MRMMKRNAKLCFFAVAFLLLNNSCTMQQEQSLLSSKTSSKDAATLILENTPFAYDMVVDTISYNSCVGPQLNSNGYIHGFKLGANEGFVDTNGSGAVKSGLKLRSDFLQYVGKNISPNFPNTAVTPSQIQYLLGNSESNKELYIQYAIRTTADLNVVLDLIQPTGQETFVNNRDGIYETAILHENPVVTNITKGVVFGDGGVVLSEGPRVYNVGSKGTPKALEASLGYTNNADDTFPVVLTADDATGAGEEYADRVRTKFNSGTYVLAQTYGNPSTTTETDNSTEGFNSPKRKNASDLRKAYGRGYELRFQSVSSKAGWRKNVMYSVIEKNLDDGSLASGASWACEKFLIMKTNQLNNKKATEPACSELTASDLADAAIGARVKLIRRHYSDALWAIGLYHPKDTQYDPLTRTNRPLCIVNKQTDCYLQTAGLMASGADMGVQYDTNSECYLSRFQQMGVTYTGNLTGDSARSLGRCPQYASICYRSSTSY